MTNTKPDFIINGERRLNLTIIGAIEPYLNRIIAGNPTNSFALGIFLKLGLKISLEFVENKTFDSTMGEDNLSWLTSEGFNAFVLLDEKHNDTDEKFVNFNFGVSSASDVEKLLDLIKNNELIKSFLSFVYLHEVNHLISYHTTITFQNRMKSITRNHIGIEKFDLIDQNSLFKIFNVAEDYRINYSILEFFKEDKKLKNHIFYIKKIGLFNDEYADKKLSEEEILKLVLDDEDIKNQIENLENQNGAFSLTDGNGKTSTVFNDVPQADQNPKDDNPKDDNPKDNLGKLKPSSKLNEANADDIASALGNSLKQDLTKAVQERGTDSTHLQSLIEGTVDVDTRWFDKLKNGVFIQVDKITKNQSVSWSGYNKLFKKHFKSPRRTNLDNTVDIIISVDNSGSMQEEDLAKVASIFENKASVIDKMTVLYHDDTIAHIDTFNGKNTSGRASAIVKSAKTRFAGGGTSHREVFQWLEDNINKKEASQKIYISFSDNFSDIENIYHNYSVVKSMKKVWLNSSGKDVEKSVDGFKVKI
jgi:hypothetical protein